MKRGTLIVLSIVGVVVLLGLIVVMSAIGTYNRIVKLDNGVEASWAQVENQLQRRFDLIPNLVNTVKGYAEHEKEVLTAVTEARSRVGSAQTIPEKISANNGLTSALGRLMVVMERYPDLKANQNFLALQSQLEGTENRISVERRRYNEAVRAYNDAVRTFPAVFIAGMMGMGRKTPFQAVAQAQTAPEVRF